MTVGHDLVRGTTEFTRVRRERVEQGDEAELATAMRMELLVEEQSRAAGEIPEPDDTSGPEPDHPRPSGFGAGGGTREQAA